MGEKQFPYDWIQTQLGESITSYLSLTPELVSKFCQLQLLSNEANQDVSKASIIFEDLHRDLKILENNFKKYDAILPISENDLPQESFQNLLNQNTTLFSRSLDILLTQAIIKNSKLNTSRASVDLLNANASQSLHQMELSCEEYQQNLQMLNENAATLEAKAEHLQSWKTTTQQEIHALSTELNDLKEKLAKHTEHCSLEEIIDAHHILKASTSALSLEKEEAKKLQTKLNKYGNLPADLNLAKVRLQQETVELQTIKEDIALVVSGITMDGFL